MIAEFCLSSRRLKCRMLIWGLSVRFQDLLELDKLNLVGKEAMVDFTEQLDRIGKNVMTRYPGSKIRHFFFKTPLILWQLGIGTIIRDN